MSDPAPLIEFMFPRIVAKLSTPKNLAKASWKTLTDEQVTGRILDEMGELRTALLDVIVGKGTWDAVLDEAIDVVDFAAMAADPDRRADDGSESGPEGKTADTVPTRSPTNPAAAEPGTSAPPVFCARCGGWRSAEHVRRHGE